MRRLRIRHVLPVLVTGIVFSSIWASQQLCTLPTCPAFKVVDGVVKTTMFCRGDVVNTDAGWLVSAAHGWTELD